MHFYRKCWFDLFKEQFISLFNFSQNYFAQLRQNWFSVRLPVTNAWICLSLYTAFSSNVEAWGMWACSLFLSFLSELQTSVFCAHVSIPDQVFSFIARFLIMNFSYFPHLKKYWINFNQTWHKVFWEEGSSSLFKIHTMSFSKVDHSKILKRARATNGKYGPVDCLKLKMIEKVLKSDYSADEYLLILCRGYEVIF